MSIEIKSTAIGFFSGIAVAALAAYWLGASNNVTQMTSRSWRGESEAVAKVSTPPALPPQHSAPAVTGPKGLPPSLQMAIRERRQGNYVRDEDISFIQKRWAALADRIVENFMRTRAPEYDREFARLGISENVRSQLIKEVSDILRSKVELSELNTALLQSQADYERRMKSLLPSNYSDYLAFEQASKARSEATRIAGYAQQNAGVTIDPTTIENLVPLIEKDSAYSQQTIGDLISASAFDGLPPQAVGQAAIAGIEKQRQELKASGAALISDATAAGLNANSVNALEEYFANNLAQYDQILNAARDPVSAQINHVQDQLSKLQLAAVPSAIQIQALERQLAALRMLQMNHQLPTPPPQ